MTDQPGDRLRFPGVEAEPGAKLHRDLGAQFRMVPAPALGDIVQQDRRIKRFARLHFRNHFAGDGVVFLEPAGLDPVQQADGPDGVLVDRVDMIHVVLHLGDDAAEVGNEPAEHTGLVEAHQRLHRILARQHFHEHPVGFFIPPQLGIDQFQVLGDEAERFRMNIQVVALRRMEQADQLHRIGGEGFLVFDGQPPAVQLEPRHVRVGEAEERQAEPLRRLFLLMFQNGAKDAGDVAHVLGDQEVMLHEPLDAVGPGPVAIAQALRDILLHGEGQAFLGPADQVMQMAAHGPKEVLGLFEQLHVGAGQHAFVDQVVHVADAVKILGDPDQGLQIAQAAFAFLDVGLQHVARVAHLVVPVVAFGEFLFDVGHARAVGDIVPEGLAELIEQRLIAPEPAGLQQRRADGQVFLGQAHGLVHGTRRMADLEAQIPQHVEHEFDNLFRARRHFVRQQEHQIDIGKRCQFAAPIPARGDDRQRLARGRAGRGIDPLIGEIVNRADQLIHQKRMGPGHLGAGHLARFEAFLDLVPALGMGLFEDRQHLALGLGRIARPADQVVELLGQRLAVDDRAGVFNGRTAHAAFIHQGGGAVTPAPLGCP